MTAEVSVFVDCNPKVITDSRTWPEIRDLAERAGAVLKSSPTPERAPLTSAVYTGPHVG